MERWKPHLIRDLLIETSLYGVFVVIYAIVVLRWLDGWLTRIFHSNLTTYAVLCLALIVGQGVLLDAITSFLLNRLKLGAPR